MCVVDRRQNDQVLFLVRYLNREMLRAFPHHDYRFCRRRVLWALVKLAQTFTATALLYGAPFIDTLHISHIRYRPDHVQHSTRRRLSSTVASSS